MLQEGRSDVLTSCNILHPSQMLLLKLQFAQSIPCRLHSWCQSQRHSCQRHAEQSMNVFLEASVLAQHPLDLAQVGGNPSAWRCVRTHAYSGVLSRYVHAHCLQYYYCTSIYTPHPLPFLPPAVGREPLESTCSNEKAATAYYFRLLTVLTRDLHGHVFTARSVRRERTW